MRPIRGIVQHYAWGDITALPRLLGRESEPGVGGGHAGTLGGKAQVGVTGEDKPDAGEDDAGGSHRGGR